MLKICQQLCCFLIFGLVPSNLGMQQPSDDQLRQSLHDYIFRNDCNSAYELLKYYPHLINKTTKEGRTPLHDAVIEYIFNFKDIQSKIYIQQETMKSCSRLIQFLFDQPDIDINIKDVHGLTPVMYFFHPEQFPECLHAEDFIKTDEINERILDLFLNREDLKISCKYNLLYRNLHAYFDLDIYLMRKLIHHTAFTLEFFKKFCKNSIHCAQDTHFVGLSKIIEAKQVWKDDAELRTYAAIFVAYDALRNKVIHEATLCALLYQWTEENDKNIFTFLNQKFPQAPVQEDLVKKLKIMHNYCTQHELIALNFRLNRELKRIEI